MESKCPCCSGNMQAPDYCGHLIVKICSKCYFRCNKKDLPRIAAAMELARELVKLERCERIGPEYHRLEKSIAQMEYKVVEVFGGE